MADELMGSVYNNKKCSWTTQVTESVISESSDFSKVCFNPIAPRKAKIVYNFGLSECNKVKMRIRFH